MTQINRLLAMYTIIEQCTVLKHHSSFGLELWEKNI